MTAEQIEAELATLRTGVLNLRADSAAYRLVLHASFIAMTPQARAALLHNVRHLGEQQMAHGLAHSQSASDQTIHAMQAAIDRIVHALEQLPAR